LRTLKFSSNHTAAPKPEVDMRVGMVADLMACGSYSSREFWEPPDVPSADEKRSRDLVTIQSLKYSFRPFARTIVEG
jgi:hypothetical protein